MEITAEEIRRRYELGVEHHLRLNMYDDTERAFRFYEGDQWYGIEDDEGLPVYNFISPTVDYKSAMVSMQNISIFYSLSDGCALPQGEEICRALNVRAAKYWEKHKLDSKLWQVVRDACIAGDSYLYFYDSNQNAQIVDNTAIYFADEQQPDLQKQAYILIAERRPVREVKKDAERYGCSKEDIDLIVPDGDIAHFVGDTDEVSDKGEDGKCTCILCLERNEEGFVCVTRSTRRVIYQPRTVIYGMRLYPIAGFAWLRRKNSIRGLGEVKPLIANQIEANRLLARRLASAKQNAFAKPVYVENMVENPEDADKVGRAIRIKSGPVSAVKDIFTYVSPAPMSAEAALLQNDLLTNTRELAGAGDAALGNINPEQASGAAIIAVQNQSAIPLNIQTADYKQFVEDIALVWYDGVKAYNPGGIVSEESMENGLIKRVEISPEALAIAEMCVKIDATPSSPFSRYAREQALENALKAGYISFEEWVDAIDDSFAAPKNEFRKIIERRKAAEADASVGLDLSGADAGL